MSMPRGMLASAAAVLLSGLVACSGSIAVPQRGVVAHGLAWNGTQYGRRVGAPAIYVFDVPVHCDALPKDGGFDVDRTIRRPTGASVELLIQVPEWRAGEEASYLDAASLNGSGQKTALTRPGLSMEQNNDGTVRYRGQPFVLTSAPTHKGDIARGHLATEVPWTNAGQPERVDVFAGDFDIEVCADIEH
jgi:hypothetical protein